MEVETVPLVTDPTRSQSESIETVLGRMRAGRVYMPDYQRDAGQWDRIKESLFIESIINNLTVPAFFFSESGVGKSEIVDGQQRLTTLRRFMDNEIVLSEADDINYLIPASIQYAGKRFSDLHENLQSIFLTYPLTIIYLPRSMQLSAKLEVFRRINEGGTPLTGQDIRLAYYSESMGVNIIRLAGIYSSSSESARRMEERAKAFGLQNPWNRHPDAKQYWEDWWEERNRTKGQTPSHMYLWYLVAQGRDSLERILKNPSYLNMRFRGTIDEALDIYCAQLLYQDTHPDVAPILPSPAELHNKLFDNFASWIEKLLGEVMPTISVEKYRQISLFISAAVELGIDKDSITSSQWQRVTNFIQNPREAGRAYLSEGYPEPKGRWTGAKGQKVQCEKAVELVQRIMNA